MSEEYVYKNIPKGTRVSEGTKISRLEKNPSTGCYSFTPVEIAAFEYTVPDNSLYEVEDRSPVAVLRREVEGVLDTLKVYRDNRNPRAGGEEYGEWAAFETSITFLEKALKDAR